MSNPKIDRINENNIRADELLRELHDLGIAVNIPITEVNLKIQAIVNTLVELNLTSEKELGNKISAGWVKALSQIRTEVANNLESELGKDWENIAKTRVKRMSAQSKVGAPGIWVPGQPKIR